MGNNIEVLISEERLAARVKELGRQLSADYAGKDPLFVCVLKGACIFFADLIRAMTCSVQFDFIQAASYGNGTSSSGEVRIVKDTQASVVGRNVVLIEDIVDSGRTLARLSRLLYERGAKSVKLCALLDKPSRRDEGGAEAEYVGFAIDDLFVVGYGLDFAERHRELPYVGVLSPEEARGEGNE